MSSGRRIVIFETRLGWAGAAATGEGIFRIVLPRKEKTQVQRELEGADRGMLNEEVSGPPSPGVLKKAAKLLRKYFSGDRVLFDLPFDIRYYTRFQRLVWQAVVEIPYGETRSYAWVAERIGRPRAARAVGQAMGANPLPVMIP